MTIYNMYIYNRQGTCVYYKEWNRKRKPKDMNGDSKLMYGLIFSLKQFVSGIAPRPSETFHSFTTNTYKVHFYESPTGFKFILNTDPHVHNLTDQLKEIYSTIWVEYVMKNPLYQPGEKVDCHLFIENLENFIKQLNCFH